MSTCAQDNYVDMQYSNSIDIGKFTDKRPTNTRLNATYMCIINIFLFNNTVYTDLKRHCPIPSYIKKVNHFQNTDKISY